VDNILKKIANAVAVFSSIVIFQFFLLGTVSYVSAEDEIESAENSYSGDMCIDVVSVYNEANSSSLLVTGASESIDSLRRNEFSSNVVLLSSLLLGSDSFCNYGDADQELSSSTREGLLGTVEGEITSMLSNPPAVNLGSHLARNFVPGYDETVTGSYAASTGYDFLKSDMGLEPIWLMFRNIAYIGFVLVLVVIGFSIMFKAKIAGQVVVSVSNTLPKVVLGLVLVTFSFAIVGFIMDLGRVAIGVTGFAMDEQLSSQGFTSQELGGVSDMYQDSIDIAYPNALAKALKDIGMITVGEAILHWDIDVGLIAGILGGQEVADSVLNAVKVIASGVKTWGLIDLIKICVIALVCLYASIRVFITMIILYLKIFLEAILGPIYVLIGTLPGNSTSIMGWIKRTFSHVLSFVLIFVILNLSRYIVSTSISSENLTFFNSDSFSVDWIISFKGILAIAGYLFAAGAPSIVSDMLNAQSSKGITQAAEGAKKALSKLNFA
jgi:hypothetical protein